MTQDRWWEAYDDNGDPLPRADGIDAAGAEALIRDAFADVAFPGHWTLSAGGPVTDEPRRVAEVFADKTDWRTLDSAFLDRAPDGQGSALSFLSDAAWRFYLPAFLIADLRGELSHARPLHTIVGGLTDEDRERRINPRLYGERTWGDNARHRLSMLDDAQVRAVSAYLEVKARASAFDARLVTEARAAWFDALLARAT